jgi:hypothetical protein
LVMAIKRALLANWPSDLDLVQADAEDFPALDVQIVEQKSLELKSSGFALLGDFTHASHTGKPTPYITRIFLNQDLKCYAEVSQLFPRQRSPHVVGVTIMSAFVSKDAAGQSESTFHTMGAPPLPEPSEAPRMESKEWTLATTDRVPDGVVWALRTPRRLLSRHPGTSVAKLLEIHLKMRGEVQPVIGEQVRCNLSREEYSARARTNMARVRERAQRVNAFRFFYDWKIAGPRQMEWWGEYATLRNRSSANGESGS